MSTYSSAGYKVCEHVGCSKKVDESIDHDCCGRCTTGRDCRNVSMATGGNSFFHSFVDDGTGMRQCAECGGEWHDH